MKNLLVILIFSVLLFSCNQENNKSPENFQNQNIQQLNNQQKSEQNVGIEDAKFSSEKKIENKESEAPIAKVSVMPLSPEELTTFLPDITGAKKLPPSQGKQSRENKFWTTVSTDYVYKGGTGVQLLITDYYEENNFPSGEIELFSKLPKESGYIVSEVKNPYGKGFKVMDLTNENGYIYFLINKRFTIKVEGYNLSKSISIDNIFNQINLKKLYNLKK